MIEIRLYLLILFIGLLLAGCAAPTPMATASLAPTTLPSDTPQPSLTSTQTNTPRPTFPPTLTPTITRTSTITPTAGPPRDGMTLVFSDEFEGSELDGAKWQRCYPWVVEGGCTNEGNHELEWYQADNVEVADGLLRLRADQSAISAPDGKEYPYTSGMVTSYQTFDSHYGYFEMRARMPKGRGLWPAFWLLPTTLEWPPEIDILEVLGHETNVVYTTLHYKLEGQPHLSQGQAYAGADFSADFHIFAADWKPGQVMWFVDGNPVFRITHNIPNQPMYLLANLAVGGDWPGAPSAETVFPSYFDIDYIRVYRDANLP
jgi:beta-glucanase (GH16 family)